MLDIADCSSQLLSMCNPFDESEPNRYEEMSIDEIIDEALQRLDGVMLTPQQAGEILDYRLYQLEIITGENGLEFDEFVSDEEFALSEIAQGQDPRSFGDAYRKYHVSFKGLPLLGGVRETGLANDLTNGDIWSEINVWKLSSDYRNRRETSYILSV